MLNVIEVYAAIFHVDVQVLLNKGSTFYESATSRKRKPERVGTLGTRSDSQVTVDGAAVSRGEDKFLEDQQDVAALQLLKTWADTWAPCVYKTDVGICNVLSESG
jgi:hypothetical protein